MEFFDGWMAVGYLRNKYDPYKRTHMNMNDRREKERERVSWGGGWEGVYIFIPDIFQSHFLGS